MRGCVCKTTTVSQQDNNKTSFVGNVLTLITALNKTNSCFALKAFWVISGIDIFQSIPISKLKLLIPLGPDFECGKLHSSDSHPLILFWRMQTIPQINIFQQTESSFESGSICRSQVYDRFYQLKKRRNSNDASLWGPDIECSNFHSSVSHPLILILTNANKSLNQYLTIDLKFV